MQVIPIEKIFFNRDSIRKVKEAFLIQEGRTIDPDGLNLFKETIELLCIIMLFNRILPYAYLEFSLPIIFTLFPVIRK